MRMCLYTGTFEISVGGCDSLQVVLDKELTTKAAVEEISSLCLSAGALWAG